MNIVREHTQMLETLEAKFSFTDCDGKKISGSYAKEDLISLLDYLGDYLWDLHSISASPDPYGGIVDTSQPITITIMRRESR